MLLSVASSTGLSTAWMGPQQTFIEIVYFLLRITGTLKVFFRVVFK